MRIRSKMLLVALVAALAASLASSSASANELSVNGEDFYIIWDDDSAGAENLDLIAGPATIECDVTLLGSFHEDTIAKVAHSLIGHITHARVQACVNGIASPLTASLPWHVTYEGFSGRLPEIDLIGLLLVGLQFRIEQNSFANCLGRADITDPAAGNALVDITTGVVDVVDALENPVSLDDIAFPSFLCDEIGDGIFEGNGDVADDEDGAGDVVVTLI
jgi:hypothetical protein